MHFYLSIFKEMANSAARRLKIGIYCVLCNRPSLQNIDICDACEKCLAPRVYKENNLRWTYLCVSCGDEHTQIIRQSDSDDEIIMNNSANSFYCCRSCQESGVNFYRIVAPYRYEFPIDHIIGRMKYGQQRIFGRVLGGLLASSVKSLESLPDILIPVPLHAARQAERGYNQAADIARWCAHELDLQCMPWMATRIFDTGSLAGLSKAARQLRILGAFSAAPDVKGCRIAIVDDVLTTGATARELARELYDTGALSVELWVLARTSSDR
jgi:ComF family protein